jgi:hypothetical protein
LRGTRFFITDVKITKQQGFGKFNVAGYWRRKYWGKVENEGWYLLTNLTSSQEAIAAFKCRSGIEAIFKDCKTGGYNLEKSHANNQRLTSLILLIAIAYSCAPPPGQKNQEYGNSKICG